MAVRGALWAGVVAALVAAPAARAEVIQTESPRNGSFSLQLGGYKPDIGATKGVSVNPFDKVFGASSMLLFTLEYDRYFWKKVGSLGVGVSAGYAEKFGKASISGQENQRTGVPTGLHVTPLRLMGIYNFDYLAFELGIPLVPYVKAGFTYIPWWVTKGDTVEFVNGERMAGGTFGIAAVGGISFLLDVLQPRMARDFDSELGVNHTYVFAEFNAVRANNFGGSKLDLSDNYWSFGIAFEF